ncbi:hypothetical protein GCM10010342_18760 [Streptomyces anulatus]|nr:hypothetical protein GCM10010342_18760 [Streptomyces anulatus]
MPTSGSIRNATASRAGTVSSRGARAPAVRRPGRLIGVTSSGSECGAVPGRPVGRDGAAGRYGAAVRVRLRLLEARAPEDFLRGGRG